MTVAIAKGRILVRLGAGEEDEPDMGDGRPENSDLDFPPDSGSWCCVFFLSVNLLSCVHVWIWIRNALFLIRCGGKMGVVGLPSGWRFDTHTGPGYLEYA